MINPQAVMGGVVINHAVRICAAIFLASVCPVTTVAATTTTLLTAPVVDPSTAWTYYGSGAAHTNGVAAWSSTPPEIVAEARSLGAGRLSSTQYAQNVTDYVRYNIAMEFRFGLGKGARGALIDQSGTAFDQAELMTKLLVQGGLSPGYRVGTLSLTAAQFGKWTGLVKNLNQAAQTFDVDAKAACQFLADGGIPATVTDGTHTTTNACTVLSGNLPSTGTPVTVGHIWVSLSGTFYDPAFKQHVLYASVDLPSAMGCGTASAPTCGSGATTAAMTGVTRSTLSGAPTTQNVAQSGLETTLAGYATSLEASIKSTNRIGQLHEIIGGKQIDRTSAPVIGTDYADSVHYNTWATIPDQFRTTLTVALSPVNTTLYADEIAGKRVRLYSYGTASTAQLALYADDQLLANPSCGWCITASGVPARTTGTLNLSVNVPYAASSGAYGDVSSVAVAIENTTAPVTVVAGFGDATRSTQQFYADLQTADPSPFHGGGSTYCTGSTALDVCREDAQPTLAAQTLAQQARADRILGAISASPITRHYAIGAVFDRTYAGTPAVVLQVATSVQSASSDATARTAAFGSSAALSSMIQGSVYQQTGDLPDVNSGVGDLVAANTAGYQFIQVVPAGWTAGLKAALTNYTSTRKTTLNTLSTAGYSFIIPQNGYLPSATDGGDYIYSSTDLGYLVDESDTGLAGTNVADWGAGAVRLAAAPSTGGLKLSPGPDIVTGEGASALSFQRVYMSDAKTQENEDSTTYYGTGSAVAPRGLITGNEADVSARLGGGWSHNWDISARIRNDAFKGMGQDSALDASEAVAGIYALYDTRRTSAFDNDLTAIFEANWVGEQFIGNAIAINRPGSSEVFQQLPNGDWNPPPGSADQIAVSSHRTGPFTITNINGVSGPVWHYSPIGLTYTDKSGAVMTFQVSSTMRDIPSGTGYGEPVFAPNTWTFPNGMKLTFSYTSRTSTTNIYSSLNKVQNSFGRYLSFTLSRDDPSGFNFLRDRITAVTDENSRSVSFATSSCPSVGANNGSGGTSRTVFLNCNTFAVTQPDTRVYTYGYAAGTDSPDPSIIERPAYHLRRWYKPSDTTNALQVVAYDELYRVKTQTNILGNQGQSFPTAVFSSDRYQRLETVDPLGASSVVLYDQFGNPFAATDPLGRTRTFAYDSAHRLTLITAPEGNSSAFAYDLRSNIISVTEHAKSGSGLSDIVVTTAYEEGPTVFTCTNIMICNEAASVDGARTDVTDVSNYTYDTGTGLTTQVLAPADTSGNRPETDYTYTAYTADNVNLLTAKSEKLTSLVSLVTNYAYDSSNRYAPLSTTVDPSGLNAVTAYTYDAVGNLLTSDGPVANTSAATDVTGYTWDANRRPVMTMEPDPDGTNSLVLPATQNVYDADGNLYLIYRGSATTTYGSSWTYMQREFLSLDAAGRKIEDTALDGTGSTILTVTDFNYDADGRTVCTALRMNQSVFPSLPSTDACSPTTTGTDGPDRITKTLYDADGEVTSLQKGVSTSAQLTYATYAYNANGTKASVTDARGNKSTYSYDGFDRLAKLQFPDPTTAGTSSTTDYEAYSYDAGSDLMVRQLRNSPSPGSAPSITNTYDALGRVTVKDVSGGTAYDVYYSYDRLGRRLYAHFASAGGSGIDYTYDTPGRLLTETSYGRTMAYSYDKAGNRTRITWPDTSYFVQYYFNGGYRPIELREWDSPNSPDVLADYQWGQLNNLVSTAQEHGNGETTYPYFDNINRLYGLTYDFAGTTNDLSLSFAHNTASQITIRAESNTAYTWGGYTAGTRTNAYDGVNRDAAVAALTGGYDPRGNLTNDGTRTYTYDNENRLLTVSGSPGITIAYDPVGRLKSTTSGGVTTQFLYAGDDLVAEYSGSTLLRRYIPTGLGGDTPLTWTESATNANREFLVPDNQGSIIATASPTGALIDIYSYGPYGEPSSWTGSRYRYTGQLMLPEVQLYFYKARVYDPAAQRFLQNDPAGYESDLDLYAYTGEDPINAADSTGMETSCMGYGCMQLAAGLAIAAPAWPVREITVTAPRWGPSVALDLAELTEFLEAIPLVTAALPVIAAGAVLGTPSSTAKDDTLCHDKDSCTELYNRAQGKAPKDAKDKDGAKAPGKPGDEEGFVDPKTGERWGKAPNGQKGWVDENGHVWVPTGPGPGGAAHGGPHWDVQDLRGGYTNVYPGGHTR